MINSLLEVDPTQIFTYVFLGILVVAIIVMFVFSSKRRKQQEQEAQNLINAVKPGNKVKTIGGICGIVVEVDSEENTFVLETGTEKSGKCYIKFDRQAIYQTDAVAEKKEEIADVAPVAQLPETAEPEQIATPELPALPELPEVPEQPKVDEEPKAEEEKSVEELRNPPPAKKKSTGKKKQ